MALQGKIHSQIRLHRFKITIKKEKGGRGGDDLSKLGKKMMVDREDGSGETWESGVKMQCMKFSKN